MKLTGGWAGRFSYHGWPAAPVAFSAHLREEGLSLSGETIEPNTFLSAATDTLMAGLAGHRTGAAVTWVKTYTDIRTHAVRYRGEVNPAATRIHGTWMIPGAPRAHGSFLMVRETGAVRVATKTAADVSS